MANRVKPPFDCIHNNDGLTGRRVDKKTDRLSDGRTGRRTDEQADGRQITPTLVQRRRSTSLQYRVMKFQYTTNYAPCVTARYAQAKQREKRGCKFSHCVNFVHNLFLESSFLFEISHRVDS